MMPVKRNNWLPGIFGDVFGNDWLERHSGGSPAVNIRENEKEYTVEVAAPGLTRDDYKIELEDNNHLVISVEKQSEKSYDSQESDGQELSSGDPEAPMNENTGSSALEEQAARESQTEQENTISDHAESGSSKKQQDTEVKSREKYLRREFSYTSFRQSMILPDNVNRENIEATVADGVLTIVIPKATEEEMAQKTKLIEVK